MKCYATKQLTEQSILICIGKFTQIVVLFASVCNLKNNECAWKHAIFMYPCMKIHLFVASVSYLMCEKHFLGHLG
jgi:hypothetical protein